MSTLPPPTKHCLVRTAIGRLGTGRYHLEMGWDRVGSVYVLIIVALIHALVVSAETAPPEEGWNRLPAKTGSWHSNVQVGKYASFANFAR